jgi:hypothetical protein
MVRRLIWAGMVLLASWAGGAGSAEASCAGSRVDVVTLPFVYGETLPVVWKIEPACPVIETGLLLGTDPAGLVSVGQPVYGHRAGY